MTNSALVYRIVRILIGATTIAWPPPPPSGLRVSYTWTHHAGPTESRGSIVDKSIRRRDGGFSDDEMAKATAAGFSFGFDDLEGLARQLSLWSRRTLIRLQTGSYSGSNNVGRTHAAINLRQ